MADNDRADRAVTTLALINEAKLPEADISTFAKAVQISASDFAKAWGLDIPVVQVGSTSATDWKIYITNRNRHAGAKGYHLIENGIPTAYCSPQASINKLYGTYTKPIMSRGKILFAEKCRDGLITVIVHEVLEMLGDSHIDTFSEVDPKVGGPWLVEVCDPVAGVNYMIPLDGKQVILPDFVYPNFYKRDGKAPFDKCNQVKAPFTIPVKTGYGFWRNALGKFIKV